MAATNSMRGSFGSGTRVMVAAAGVLALLLTGVSSAAPSGALPEGLRKALAEQAGLRAPDFAADDQFGTAVAVHGDTAVIGAPFDDIGANAAQGSAYVFVRHGSAWQLQTKMTAFDGAANDQFGFSVAVYGDRVVVGAPADDVGSNGNQGSVYVFQRDAGGWYFASKITEAGGAASDLFGWSVALAADALAVGVPRDDYAQLFEVDVGSVQVFVPGAGPFDPWTRQRRLVADASFNAAGGAELGHAVAFSGDTVIAGAPFDAYGGTDAARGSAFVFVRSGTTWTTQAKLLGAASSPDANFGDAVALYGDTAVVGAPADAVGADILLGSAYVFTRSGGTWGAGVRLLPNDPELELRFGSAVALSEDTVVVGALLDDIDANPYQGSAYVFQRSTGGSWPLRQKLLAPDGAAGDRYGAALAMHGRTVVVGAWGDSTGATVAHGSAHVVVAQDRAGFLGSSVAVSGGTVVSAVPSDDLDVGSENGSIYVHERLSTGWSLQARLVPWESAVTAGLGSAVAIDGDTLVAGARTESAAYVFERSGGHWRERARWSHPGLGAAVALEGDVAAISEQVSNLRGYVDLFRRSGGAWSQFAQLQASDGGADDRFGLALAFDGGLLAVGSPGATLSGATAQGAVYLFDESTGSWGERQKLVAPDGAAGDEFGSSIALAGDTLLVGATLFRGSSNYNGAAYVFARSGGIWSFQQKLTPAATGTQFGASVAVLGAQALVGAPAAGSGGAAFRFVRSGATWTPAGALQPPALAVGDRFGEAVALDTQYAVVGSPYRDLPVASDAGATWIFGAATGVLDSELRPSVVLPNLVFADSFE